MSLKSSYDKIHDEPYINAKFSPPGLGVPNTSSSANINKKRKKERSVSKRKPPMPNLAGGYSLNQSNSQDSIYQTHNNNSIHNDSYLNPRYLGDTKKNISAPIFSDKDCTEIRYKDYGPEINSLKISSVALCPNQLYLFIGDNTGNLYQILSFKNKIEKVFKKAHDSKISCLAITHNNKHLFSADVNGNLKQLSVKYKKIIYDYGKIFKSNITGLYVSEDSEYLFAVCGKNQLKQFAIKHHSLFRYYGKIHKALVKQIAFTCDNLYFFACDVNGYLKQYSITGSLLRDYGKITNNSIHSMICSEDSKYLFLGENLGGLKQIDIENLCQYKDYGTVWAYGEIDYQIRSTDGRYIFVANFMGNLMQLSLDSQENLEELNKHQHLYNKDIDTMDNTLKVRFNLSNNFYKRRDFGQIHCPNVKSIQICGEYQILLSINLDENVRQIAIILNDDEDYARDTWEIANIMNYNSSSMMTNEAFTNNTEILMSQDNKEIENEVNKMYLGNQITKQFQDISKKLNQIDNLQDEPNVNDANYNSDITNNRIVHHEDSEIPLIGQMYMKDEEKKYQKEVNFVSQSNRSPKQDSSDNSKKNSKRNILTENEQTTVDFIGYSVKIKPIEDINKRLFQIEEKVAQVISISNKNCEKIHITDAKLNNIESLLGKLLTKVNENKIRKSILNEQKEYVDMVQKDFQQLTNSIEHKLKKNNSRSRENPKGSENKNETIEKNSEEKGLKCSYETNINLHKSKKRNVSFDKKQNTASSKDQQKALSKEKRKDSYEKDTKKQSKEVKQFTKKSNNNSYFSQHSQKSCENSPMQSKDKSRDRNKFKGNSKNLKDMSTDSNAQSTHLRKSYEHNDVINKIQSLIKQSQSNVPRKSQDLGNKNLGKEENTPINPKPENYSSVQEEYNLLNSHSNQKNFLSLREIHIDDGGEKLAANFNEIVQNESDRIPDKTFKRIQLVVNDVNNMQNTNNRINYMTNKIEANQKIQGASQNNSSELNKYNQNLDVPEYVEGSQNDMDVYNKDESSEEINQRANMNTSDLETYANDVENNYKMFRDTKINNEQVGAFKLLDKVNVQASLESNLMQVEISSTSHFNKIDLNEVNASSQIVELPAEPNQNSDVIYRVDNLVKKYLKSSHRDRNSSPGNESKKSEEGRQIKQHIKERPRNTSNEGISHIKKESRDPEGPHNTRKRIISYQNSVEQSNDSQENLNSFSLQKNSNTKHNIKRIVKHFTENQRVFSDSPVISKDFTYKYSNNYNINQTSPNERSRQEGSPKQGFVVCEYCGYEVKESYLEMHINNVHRKINELNHNYGHYRNKSEVESLGVMKFLDHKDLEIERDEPASIIKREGSPMAVATKMNPNTIKPSPNNRSNSFSSFEYNRQLFKSSDKKDHDNYDDNIKISINDFNQRDSQKNNQSIRNSHKSASKNKEDNNHYVVNLHIDDRRNPTKLLQTKAESEVSLNKNSLKNSNNNSSNNIHGDTGITLNVLNYMNDRVKQQKPNLKQNISQKNQIRYYTADNNEATHQVKNNETEYVKGMYSNVSGKKDFGNRRSIKDLACDQIDILNSPENIQKISYNRKGETLSKKISLLEESPVNIEEIRRARKLAEKNASQERKFIDNKNKKKHML